MEHTYSECGEDAGSGKCSYSPSTFDNINCMKVVCVYYPGTDYSAEKLSEHIDCRE